MKIYILRHGTTEWNRLGRLQGIHNTPLNQAGRDLARETSKGMKDVHLDLVISSPLDRAYETAQIVCEGRDIPFIKDERLKEIDFGEWEGLVCAGENAQITHEDMKRYNDLSDGNFKSKSGESLNEVIARAEGFMQDLLSRKELEEKSILLSTHGAFARALNHCYWQDNDFWHGCVPPNCSVSILTAKNGKLIDLEADHIYYAAAPENFYSVK